MKKIIFILIVIFYANAGFSQDDEAMKKLESAKIGLITERLGLTPEQAEQFWPVYNEYLNRMKTLRSEFRQRRENLNEQELSEQERQKLIDLGFSFKERQIDLEKAYSERLLRIISSKQLLSLRKAEEDFRNMLLRRLQQRQMQQKRKEQFEDRIERRKEMRRNN